MNELRYSLIRLIPDPDRMEPVNFGVILQASERIDFKLYPHFAKRKDVDTITFQKWKAFLEEEIKGEPVPMLQPRKTTPQFLTYLSGLCEETVSITKPLYIEARKDEAFDDILAGLYERLVIPPEAPKREQSPRPTHTFRDIELEKQFMKRGMKKHSYIPLPDNSRWNAYRQVLNGQNIVVDKVEVGNFVGLTADEIAKLSGGVNRFLGSFMQKQASGVSSRYVLIADTLKEPFSDQTKDNFDAMRDELNKVIIAVRDYGGEVLTEEPAVLSFTQELDKKLPPLDAVKKTA